MKKKSKYFEKIIFLGFSYLFWTDWADHTPSVSRSYLDGTSVTTLITTPHVYWPNSVTVDYMSGNRIYWVDAKYDYIAFSDLNGKGMKKVVHNRVRITLIICVRYISRSNFLAFQYFSSLLFCCCFVFIYL